MSDRIIPRQAGRDLPRWQFPGFDKAQPEAAPEPVAAPPGKSAGALKSDRPALRRGSASRFSWVSR
ncbi:MAG TPA: hypothetical protein PK144_05475, partial [Plasticicumulans sp.]|nr:hypothetical protein [Plasticicumulans sp.]